MTRIYADNAATTKVKPEVFEAMAPYLSDEALFYNPSSSYEPAYAIAEKIESVRNTIARSINCDPDEIYFTSGGSEANNMAIKGTMLSSPNRSKWESFPIIITTKIEHHSVINACRDLVRMRFAKIAYANVNQDGIVEFDHALRNKRNVKLMSIMYANNEIGTTQPIEYIGQYCKENNILLHTDAVQAFGKYEIDVKKLNIDLMSVSGHKFGAPKGIGFLYARKGVNLSPIISGGQQERGLRAGTENVPYIVGLGKAVEIAMRDMEENRNKEKRLKYKLWIALQDKCELVKINGHPIVSAPNIINFSFANYGIRGERMLAFLDQNGICASSGSACNSHSAEPSHVLKAIGLSDDEAECSIRFSFNEDNTDEDINKIVSVIEQGIEVLRQ